MNAGKISLAIVLLLVLVSEAAMRAAAERVGDLPADEPAPSALSLQAGQTATNPQTPIQPPAAATVLPSQSDNVPTTDRGNDSKIVSPVTLSATPETHGESGGGQVSTHPPRDLGNGVTVQDCAVRFAEELNLPSSEAGLIAQLHVHVGQSVTTGDAIARLDDRTLKIRSRAALLRLSAAEEQVRDDVELRYAETARAEAIVELEASRAIYNESSGAMPHANVRRLKLAVERAELDVVRAQKAAKQAQIEVDVRAADVALIEDTLRRYSLSSPINGVVLQVFKQRGEWVASGEAVVRLARLDRLQVQALMSSDQCSPNECLNQPVSVNWTEPTSGRKLYLRGRVTSVQPQRLAGGRYRIQAEIVNDRTADGKAWLLHPGTEVEMVVYPPRGLISSGKNINTKTIDR